MVKGLSAITATSSASSAAQDTITASGSTKICGRSMLTPDVELQKKILSECLAQEFSVVNRKDAALVKAMMILNAKRITRSLKSCHAYVVRLEAGEDARAMAKEFLK